VIVRLPLTRLIQNTTITLAENPYFHQPCFRDSFFFHRLRVVGSCNGLLCLYGYVVGSSNCYEEIFLYLWNPATKALSNKIVFLQDELHLRKFERQTHCWTFWFGYDNSTDNYKIVAFCLMINEVRVLNLGDNVWRYIQSFPVVPLDNYSSFPFCHQGINNSGVYVSGTINWLAIPNVSMLWPLDIRPFEPIDINRFVIISLDLSTETYRQFLPPLGDEVVSVTVEPTLTVLMDSLCFSHDFHVTHFIIWQMKEFGFEESWTRFLKISYTSFGNFRTSWFPLTLFPLCLSDNGDTLIVVCEQHHSAILYNLKYDRGENIRISNLIQWFCAQNYIESLVPTS
jgi:F-box interacting protein